MNSEEINKFIAEKVMGLSECGKWHEGSLGSAGGHVLMTQNCEHAGLCYPERKIQTTFGVVGGCPDYIGKEQLAWEVVDKIYNEEGNEYEYSLISHGNGYTFQVYKEASLYVGNGSTRAEAICHCILNDYGVKL